jgi:hypothetical protein
MKAAKHLNCTCFAIETFPFVKHTQKFAQQAKCKLTQPPFITKFRLIFIFLRKLDIDGPTQFEENSDFAPRNPLDKTTKKEDLIERHLFYSWSKSSNLSFRRGKAFIFYDERHAKYTSELATTFQQLQYKTTIGSLRDIEVDTCNIFHILSKTKSAMAYDHLTAGIFLRQGFFYDGSLILCILAELEETSAGLCYRDGNQLISLSTIVDRFCGQKCLPLIGKPKIFFFLDEGTRTDGKTQEHELAVGFLALKIKYYSINVSVLRFTIFQRACWMLRVCRRWKRQNQ